MTDLPVEALWGIGTLFLLVVLIWGTMQYARRNRANDSLRDAATRDVYRHPMEQTELREEIKRDAETHQ